jgi:glycosyltransferase involved in cell wall biosynthesis
MEGHFRIVTTVYNAEDYIEDCIKSVLGQTDERWTQVVIVDGATDATAERAELAASGDPRITIVKKPERKGICDSHKMAHNMSPREEGDVFIHLDGDDFLLYRESLEYIRDVYTKNLNIWATYGSYIAKSGASCISRPVDLTEGIREQIKKGWPFSHPRTFRAFLWDKIKEDYLRDSEGNDYTSAVDVAIMSPILEMCGNRIAFIKNPLYFYNDKNELNEHKVSIRDQARCALDVLSKNKLQPL